MTRPLWKSDRTRLMIGCGSAALALAMALAPQGAAAQGIQASPSLVSGSATVTTPAANTTRIDVSSQTAVIDWTPFLDNSGNALAFLPTGSTANFRGTAPNFAVLNRILPTTNNNIGVIDGSVLSQFGNPSSGFTTGGFIAFYSPTGILVGPNARFDVGSLMLTTLDTSPASFTNFANGGFLSLQGQQGSRATITVSPGAQIAATRENSFFTIVAADVEMRGTALVNGSHAYVAGEVVDMRFSNGLFDIFVSAGTAASGEVVTLNGTIGGPSSNGVGDDHMIYAVARASQDPISMLLSGNIGFDPAQSAGIINGEIILAANYNVSGRRVAGGSIEDGINAVFFGNNELSATRADIFLDDFTATSSLLAAGTHRTQARAINAAASVTGNLLLVGREQASAVAVNGRTFTVTGDVLVNATDYGVLNSSLQSLDVINAQGGQASLNAAGGTIRIGGNVSVTADAFGGADTLNRVAGTARGGQARMGANGGSLAISGTAMVSAGGFGVNLGDIITGAEARGGLAQFFVTQGGSASVGENLLVMAEAVGATGSINGLSTVSNAFGGEARIIGDLGGSAAITGFVFVGARAIANRTNTPVDGALADAGVAEVFINANNTLTIGGDLLLAADAFGGENAGGRGGQALGGAARAVVQNGGRISAGGISASADARGGAGTSGGDARGGIAGANAISGSIEILGLASASAAGTGGGADVGFSGNGGIGRGGNAFFQAGGTSSAPARLTIGGSARVLANGTGGDGGTAGEGGFPAGPGGDGFGGEITTPNQADPAFGNGAFLLASGDYGTLSVTGRSEVAAQGVGGRGGLPLGLLAGGKGGNGFGGLAQVGLALLGGPGTVGGGSATFSGDLLVNASGLGGDGGRSVASAVAGDGGTGNGGDALLSVLAGVVTTNQAQLTANGFGGSGATGGDGLGGVAKVLGGLGGVLNATGLDISAQGFGGFAFEGRGGSGFGGTAGLEIDGISATIEGGNLSVDASGSGANSANGPPGNGTGGTAYISSATGRGTLSVRGHTSVFANGLGADSFGDFAAGNGRGGLAFIDAFNGSTMSFNTVQVGAVGRGGTATSHEGGDGSGGTARLRASGAGSSVTILRNITNSTASDSTAGNALLNANGLGQDTFGGDGIGGAGSGGTIDVTAAQGGRIALPANPLSDPDSVGAIRLVALGLGGGTSVEGGTGGAGNGGAAQMFATGGTITMGRTVFRVFGSGGSSLLSTSNVTGGAANAGSRTIGVSDGGEMTLEMDRDERSGATGGNGSGTGNGGRAIAGDTQINLNQGILNIVGVLDAKSYVRGGNGALGGDAGSGSGEGLFTAFRATDSTINVTPDAGGGAGILFGGEFQGGEGTVTGGSAAGSGVLFNLDNTDMTGGSLTIEMNSQGGNGIGPNGSGGDARFGRVEVNIFDSAANLIGDNQIRVNARGGNGGLGTGARGGLADSGSVLVSLNNSTVTITPSQFAAASFYVQSLGVAGEASQSGDASASFAQVRVRNSSIQTDLLGIESSAISPALASSAVGGFARADLARITFEGTSQVTANTLIMAANAFTTRGGTSQGGLIDFRIEQGSQTQINVGTFSAIADGTGNDDPLSNIAGRFNVEILGGSLNAATVRASARGGTASSFASPSRIAANGGNLNVTGSLLARVQGNLQLQTGQGGIIGNAGAVGNITTIELNAAGSIETLGDGSAGSGLAGQAITMNAGRSILLGSDVTGRGGAISLTANSGGGLALASPPASVITMAPGSRITAGTGSVTMRLLDGGSDPQRIAGAITLANIAAGRIDVRNLGLLAGSNITVRSGSVLTASGTGRAIDLASLNGEVINLAGDAGLVLTGGGHYGIFAATPTGSQIGNFATYARRYNVANAAAYDTFNPGGNFAAFRIVPFLTVTAAAASRFYGNANPTFTASFAGFLPGDGVGNIAGTPLFTTLATGTSNIGQFAINAALGSLLSAQGYQFNFAPGVLNVTPRPLIVTASNLSRLYGNANPALIFAIGGLGLVNGDLLTGALATTAGTTTGVGNIAITQGTLAASANYALTFVNGQLGITPRLLTVSADNLSKLLGTRDPVLTFVLSGDGLVNGDQLSGALLRDAGERIGEFAVRQGTLGAGSNYAITYVGGQLTIEAPPAPPGINNPTNFVPPIRIGGQPPLIDDEDEKRFGIDFPKNLETPLISEDPLLDDPVTSGGDASVYGDTAAPGGGGK